MPRPDTPAPAAAAGAGLAGRYQCTTDRCSYEVLQATKAQGGGLLLRRRAPGGSRLAARLRHHQRTHSPAAELRQLPS